MTDAIKVSDMLPVDYERRRHLTNWLIESSPHMPKPAPYQQPQLEKQKKNFTTSIFHDSFFFLSKFGPNASTPAQSGEQEHQILQSPAHIISTQTVGQPTGHQHTNLSKASAAFTSSQTNLPLQIVQSSRDGNKAKLRRFNSHDTSANMFSVADFENARLARRNELELVRQKQRYKINSLSSGCDSSTGDSKGSKMSNEMKTDPMSVESFLDRFSLPRVARLMPRAFNDDHQQKQQNHLNTILGKSKKLSINSNQQPSNNDTNHSDNGKADNNNNGELFLLYRHLKKYKLYHAVNGKSGTNRKKGIKIPQDFTGYFSLVNEKGTPTATQYTTMTQLVRERVYKFLSIDNMQAYTESNPSDNHSSKSHYVKITAKAGEVFRLLAVFEDGAQDSKSYSSPKKDNSNSIGREKEKGRYVQLMSENRQIIFVALSTKGKFYEIDHNVPQLFSKNSSNNHEPKQLNADCVHRINSIISEDTTFPINLRFISKHSGVFMQNAIIPENIKITKLSIEDSVIACPIDETEFCNPLHLVKLNITPEMKFSKCTLGFENEKAMFSNQNVQNLLKFCQFNIERISTRIEYENLPKENIDNLTSTGRAKTKAASAFSKFFSSEKNSSAHEREDSIIFLSKLDLENLKHREQSLQENPKLAQEGKKGWLKNLRNGSASNSNTNPSTSKNFRNLNSNSMDRYQDMSKMIQERFGTVETGERTDQTTTIKSSSEISYDLNDCSNKAIQKCFSLQNIELNSSMDLSLQQQPCTIQTNEVTRNATDDDKIEKMDRNDDHSSNVSTLQNSDRSQPRQQSFITEKLFNEFYVKTKQYSKSSSSLHQLLHFSVPQKMNIRETKKQTAKSENEERKRKDEKEASALMHLTLPPPPPSTESSDEAVLRDDISMLTDDLPYCSVRDSIFLHSESSAARETPTESIYAEICATDSTDAPYQIEKPIRASNKQNISSVRIFFGQDAPFSDFSKDAQ